MSDEIREGALVELKSGGPLMAVSSTGTFNSKPTATCNWFNQESGVFKFEQAVIPVAALKLIQSS